MGRTGPFAGQDPGGGRGKNRKSGTCIKYSTFTLDAKLSMHQTTRIITDYSCMCAQTSSQSSGAFRMGPTGSSSAVAGETAAKAHSAVLSTGTNASDPSRSATGHSRSLFSIGTGNQLFADVAIYRAGVVALKHVRKDHIQISRNVLLEFNQVYCHAFLFITS